MPLGVIIALIAYGVYSCSDATLKSLGQSLSVFEIGFFTSLFSLLPAMLTKPKGEHWRHTFRLRHPWLLQLRGFSGLCSTLLVIYGFTTIPLAEVYALVFLTPIFITIISVVVMKEQVRAERWVLLAATFLGVLLVVRPGFRELHWGQLAAVVAAVFSSINTSVLRHVSNHETRTSLIGVLVAYALVANGLLMLPGFVVPSTHELMVMLAVGLLGGAGQILFISATRLVPASQVAPAQYSQIVWAVVLGAIFYREFPDHIALFGLAIVVTAGVMNVLSDDRRAVLWGGVAAFASRRRHIRPPQADRPMTPAPMPEAVVMQRK